MKFLKSYRLFESSDEKISDEIFSDINDILLEIEDMGINVDSSNNMYYYIDVVNRRPAILIDIETDGGDDYFYLSGKHGNISDCLLRLRDYVLKNGCDIVMVNMPDDPDDYLEFEYFFDEYVGEDLHEIQVIIYKK